MKRHRFYGFFCILALISFLSGIDHNTAKSKEYKPITLNGNIFEEFCSDVCHPPATAKFEILDESGKIIFSGQTYASSQGTYSIPGLYPGETYYFSIRDTNYLINVSTVNIPFVDKYSEYSRDFLVTPKKKGAEILFAVSPFKYHTFKLKEGYNFYTEGIAKLIKENPEVNFTIACFPDNDDNKENNMFLTMNRCKNLKDFFVSLGVDGNRLNVQPNPNTDPMNPPPYFKEAKGRRYNGSTYLIVE